MTATAFRMVLDGRGTAEIAGERFEWTRNDMLLAAIGQYRAQQCLDDGAVQEIP